MVECVCEFRVFDDADGVVNAVERDFRWVELEGFLAFADDFDGFFCLSGGGCLGDLGLGSVFSW